MTIWCNQGTHQQGHGFHFLSTEAQKYQLDDYRMWEVARCTSAALTYFSGYRIRNISGGIHKLPAITTHPNRLYVVDDHQTTLHDGGLWYNNPTKLVYKALQDYQSQSEFPVTKQNTLAVSLGTGQAPVVNLNASPGIFNAISPLIESSFVQKDQEVDGYFKRYFRDNYYRLQPRLTRNIPLDDSSSANLKELKAAAETLFSDETLEILARRLTENKANRYKLQL